MIRPPGIPWDVPGADQEGDSKAGGTRVVFPAPGGAESTRLGLAAKASRIAGRTESIGSSNIINVLYEFRGVQTAVRTVALRRPVAR
jgi:hypothetical protein